MGGSKSSRIPSRACVRMNACMNAPLSLRLLTYLLTYCLPYCCLLAASHIAACLRLPYRYLLRITVSKPVRELPYRCLCGFPYKCLPADSSAAICLCPELAQFFSACPAPLIVRSLRPSVERLFSTTMLPCSNLADIPSHPLLNLAVFLHEPDQVLRCGNGSVAGYGYRP